MASTLPQTVYSPFARFMHWTVAVFVVCMAPVGFIMAERASRNVFDGLTNNLYSAHKLAGFIVLWLVVARLAYRLVKGAPPDEPSLEPWQKAISHLTHWALYALLLLVPLTGWLGVSLFPALDIFGLFSLPGIASPNSERAAQVLGLHGLLVRALLALSLLHLGAALFHHFVRKDGVLRRMLPGRA